MMTCPFCASSLPEMSVTCSTCGASLSSPALEIGAVIGGKYQIENVLGQGGFGITYLALDTTLDHLVAIKELFPDGSIRKASNVIPPAGMDFAQTKQKFLEEARVVQRFDHAGIVRVYGVLEGNQTAYMVMEALSGATLAAEVAQNGAFPPKAVLELARQLCASLEIVHDADLLHRDIKPDNVFLTSDGRVVLIDFGSARGFAQGQVKRLTRLVTPGYAAPEQYASQAAFGTYTDVYGLAATLYYVVEGQMPPMATDLMLGARLEFKNAGQLQAGLEAGLKVKVDERPQTVGALLDLLEQPVAAPRIASTLSPAIPARTAALLYDQDGISISMDEIIVQGKSFSVSSIKGYKFFIEDKGRAPSRLLRLMMKFNIIFWIIIISIPSTFIKEEFESNPLDTLIGLVFLIMILIAVILFNLKYSLLNIIMFTVAFFAVNLISFSIILSLVTNNINKFVLVFKTNKVHHPRQLEVFETKSFIKYMQFAEALNKVIPKIP
jgi:serine/threonine protein kinase